MVGQAEAGLGYPSPALSPGALVLLAGKPQSGRQAGGVAAADGAIEACISLANCSAVRRPVQSPPSALEAASNVTPVSGRSCQTMTSGPRAATLSCRIGSLDYV